MGQSRALEILVGLFVCLGVAAAFVLTLRVSNLSGGTGPGYTVEARFQNIGGLRAGAPVTLAGYRIGRVQDISVDADYFEAVVKIEIDSSYNNIPADSNASILTAGLLGEQYIGLTPGGALESLAEGDEIKFTQSALILENIIGQFLFSQASQNKAQDEDKNASSSSDPFTIPDDDPANTDTNSVTPENQP